MQVTTVEGDLCAKDARFAIVVGRFNSFVVDHLAEGAIDVLVRHGVDKSQITVVKAPGAWEIPLVVQKLAQRDQFDAIIALGAVIRGGTPHFEYVAGECSKGLAQVQMEHGVVIANGVLTVESIEQAIERSGTKMGNKGCEAALAALEMVSVMRELDK